MIATILESKRYAAGVAAVCVLAALAFAAQPPSTNVIKLNGHNFTLPSGFTIELVAESPLVDRPIMADFDEQGRLYVADSSGSNDKPEVQLREKPHRIVRLDPAGADGIFHRSVEFADKMMFPEGVLWHDGSLYVGAPPSIWKLTDTTGGGAADKRDEWFTGKTLTGCANDLHGPYLGPDGRIYWCKGAFAKQTHERPGREPIVSRAAHVFRARADGSDLEAVMTGGMDNPVEVAWSASGERFFTTTFIQHPGGGRRDAIVHSIYGGVYGKENDANDDHPRTSPHLMPVMTHLGPAAPSGLCRYESALIGDGYRDSLFATLFNMRKVTRHALVPDGATFRTIDSDFLVSDNFDFHPTDVLEDADGSLLVIDTGGWYKLCCPTAQLAKPDVLGAIYRVRRLDAPKIDDPRGLKLDWSNPKVDWLYDVRPAVRRRAIAALAKKNAVAQLAHVVQTGQAPPARRNAIWTLTRIDGPNARAGVLPGMNDGDESVVAAACCSAGVWRDREAVRALSGLLEHKSAFVRRAAAEAIGRCGNSECIPNLLRAAGRAGDRALDHAITFALIEIADPERTRHGVEHANASVRRSALIALDQMRDGKPDPNAVIAAWKSDDAGLCETAAWILARHPEWGEKLAVDLRERFKKQLNPSEREEFIRLLARMARSPHIQAMLAQAAGQPGMRAFAISAMRQAAIKPVPPAWIDAVSNMLTAQTLVSAPETLDVVRGWALPRDQQPIVSDRLKAIARESAIGGELRLKALAALTAGALRGDPDLVNWLYDRVLPNEPLALRSSAADIIARGGFATDQLLALTAIVQRVGATELERVLDAFAGATDEQIGERLLAALATRKQELRVATLRPRLVKFSPAILSRAESLYQEIDAASAKQAEMLEKMIAKLHGGDVRRGQLIFNGTKAACSACHAVGYLGGNIGPDLTKIGAIRTERDLLESIVFPSASFVRGYEPVSVMTRRGVPVNGLLKRETPDEVEITTSATDSVRVPRDEIESISPGTVSIMPAGFDQQLSVQDFADLLAFLKTCR